MEAVVNIIIHVIFVALFINTFYFTVGQQIEGDSVKTQIDSTLDEMLYDFKTLSPETLNYAKPYISSLNYPDAGSDDAINASNDAIKTYALSITAVIFVIGLAVSVFLIYKFKLDWKGICVTNFVSLFLIMMVYVMYTVFVVAKYRSIDSNFVIETVLESLKN